MDDDPLVHKLQFLSLSILIVVSFFVVAFLWLTSAPTSAEAENTSTNSELSTALSSDPNVVTNGMMAAIDGLDKSLKSTEHALVTSTQTVATATVQSGKAIADGIAATGRTIGAGASTVGRAVGGGVMFVARLPAKAVGTVTNTSAVRTVIRPSEFVEVPIIDPNSPALHAAIAALPPTQNTSQNSAGPAWPIHGEITTPFGVPHWPYQPTHSGLDISDGQPSGVTPIKPFRPGRVIDTVISRYGLGNHVIVDHGSGVTSVYAHLASISVAVGQNVTLGTILGLEGSTGLSTGPHLHFEIRVDGQAADPRQFINGQP